MEHQLEKDQNFVRVLIEPDDHDVREFHLYSCDIQHYILDQICANRGKEPYPQFNGGCIVSNEGAIIINPHVDTVGWLEKVIKSYNKMALRITNFKDSPQYAAKVEGQVAEVGPEIPVVKLLQLLEAQNAGLRADKWRVVRFHNYFKRMTFLTDDAGMKVLEENGFKLFVGFTSVTFELVERVKRCEITGKIVCDDSVEGQLEED